MATKTGWWHDSELVAGADALKAAGKSTGEIGAWLEAQGIVTGGKDRLRSQLSEIGISGKYLSGVIDSSNNTGLSDDTRPHITAPDSHAERSDPPTITREEQARRRLSDLQEENRALRRELAERADIVDALRSEFASMPHITVTPPATDTRPHRPRTLLLCLSDVHTGQLFELERGGGLGEYNLDVFEERMDRIASKVLAIASDLRAGGPVDHLVINCGGDMLDGADVYSGQVAEAEGLAAQLRVGPDVMAQTLIKRFAAAFAKVDIFYHPGNHGRPGGRKSPSDYVKGSLDAVFVDIMRVHCRDIEHITWHRSETWFSYYTIYGHSFFAAHGDAFKAWLGIPFYGSIRYMQRIQSMLHRPVDALIVGHHHNAAAFPVGWSNIIMNGSVPGNSTLGTWLGLSGPPIQKLLCVSQDHAVATQYDLHLATRQEMLTVEPVHLTS